MSKLNNTVIFASNEGGHFAQLMALKELFSKYDTVVLTDNKRANRSIPALKDVKEIEFAMSFANKREELTKNKEKKMTHASYLGSYYGLFKECYAICKKHRPKVIISTGSNIAVPLCFQPIGWGIFVSIIINAMISGVPLIAPDWMHNKYFLKDGKTAMIIPVHDAKALAIKMQKCIDCKVDLAAMALHSQKTAQSYDSKKVITYELLKEIDII